MQTGQALTDLNQVGHGLGLAYVDVFFPCKNQKLLQLGTKEFTAWRVFESQSGERINDAIGTGIGTITGFHPNDGDNDGSVHAIGLFRPFEDVRVLLPETDTTINPFWRKKNIAVFMPWLGFFGRSGNGFEDVVAFLRLLKQSFEFLAVELVALFHFFNECLFVRVILKVACAPRTGSQCPKQTGEPCTHVFFL